MAGGSDDIGISTAVARIAALLAAEDAGEQLEAVADFGHYTGTPPQIMLLDDGRKAKLLAPIAYYRPDGSDWPVPAGADLDGASIPRPFWSLIGGPLEGKYRNASIVHDRYCVTQDRSWEETHRMFYDAMRCSGTGRALAGVMFYAVYRFGPRWPAPGLEAVGIAVSVPPIDADAETLVRDAEAIATFDLGPDQIAALADAREATVSLTEATAEAPSAALLVVAGGSGTAEDVAAVGAAAGALPGYVVDHFFDQRVRIVACRGSVTDFEHALRGVVPRGWEATGRSWDSVPGTYFHDPKRVVIATVVGPDGARVVPDKATRLHGSDDLVVHESLHGYDYTLGHRLLRDAGFAEARERDSDGLTGYERQQGQVGLEETFAETGAQHCADPAALGQRCPHLASFWDAMPVTETEGVAEAAAGPQDTRGPLGIATREDDGRIVLDLRATDGSGAIGHALLDIAPDDPAYRALDDRLFPPSIEEGTGPRTAVFEG